MLKLYDFELSGHAHRVRLMLSLLDLPYEKITVDLPAGEHKQPAYQALNPFSQVPVLVDGSLVIRDSVAIIVYLANKYGPTWYPQDPDSVARIQEWLALAGRELAEGPARARLITVFGADYPQDTVIEQSHRLLTIIEAQLSDRDWVATDQASIADIACYSYIAHAPEGKVFLHDYPNILRWLTHVETLEHFLPMQKTPLEHVA